MPLTGGVVITQGGIGSNIRVSCPPGYTLYNCGAGNIQQNIPDAFRFAYPINNLPTSPETEVQHALPERRSCPATSNQLGMLQSHSGNSIQVSMKQTRSLSK